MRNLYEHGISYGTRLYGSQGSFAWCQLNYLFWDDVSYASMPMFWDNSDCAPNLIFWEDVSYDSMPMLWDNSYYISMLIFWGDVSYASMPMYWR